VTVPEFELPPGTHYALTVNIPDHYSGMTASMLQRSRAFVTYGGVDVTILTYQHRDDLDEVRGRLRDAGAMVDGMQLANFWEDLGAWDAQRVGQAGTSFASGVPADFEPLGDRGVAIGSTKRELADAQGEPQQIDYFRPDGTLLLSDRRAPDPADRQVVLCDPSGEPLGAWPEMFPLYALWFDSLKRDPVAWIIVDSKSAANVLLRYRRADVAKLHVVRGSHLQSGTGEATNRDLVGIRGAVLQELDAWDAVVFLTESQRADVESRFGPRNNLAVIPNSRNVPTATGGLRRRGRRGVMLASLEGRKRVDHAIRAIASVERDLGRRPWRPRLRLDVWGDGPLRESLANLIRKLKAPARLRGHAPGAAKEFASASFSLLTSRAEAFGNVLIESMGRGCIPISYDIDYGPSDIITHGVDGFLVPDGDVEALAARIRSVVTAPAAELAPMREAGRRRALDFSDEHAMGLWSKLLADVRHRRKT
jgi:poly(glycerol-phosphate) alpha-glucosyltransferase